MRVILGVIASVIASCAASSFYVVTEQAALQEMNATTAAVIRTVVPALPYELLAQNKGAMDNDNGIFYILGYNQSMTVPNLVGVDVSSGDIVCDATLPFAESGFIGVGQQVMYGGGNVYVGGRLEAHGNHTVGQFDCSTKKYTKIAEVAAADLPVLGGASTYIDSTKDLMIQLGVADNIDNFLINVATGAVTRVPEDSQQGRVVTTLDYDAAKDQVVGLGIRPNSTGGIERTLVSFDPHTHQYSTIGEIDGFLIESGGESAINTQMRTLTWIGQPTGASPTDPFDLITVSLTTAQALSSPNLCPNDAACPWIIHYKN